MRNTVLVLGAGASCDFGLPTGDALSRQIEAMLTYSFDANGHPMRGDDTIYAQCIGAYPGDQVKVVQFFEAGAKLSRSISYSRSIDDALFKFGDDRFIVQAGKVAIVAAILYRERQSWLYKFQTLSDDNARYQLLKSNSDLWLLNVLRLIQSKIKLSEARSTFSDLIIINFNYDRCLEHYLFHALQPAFSIGEADAVEILSRLRIIRPYGKVASLPWEVAKEQKLRFGQNVELVELFEMSSNVRTFMEQQHDSEDMQQAKYFISKAQQIAFLGFGYHPQNIEFLGSASIHPNLRMYGTVFNTSSADQEYFKELIYRYIMNGGEKEISFQDADCSTFVRDYGLALFG